MPEIKNLILLGYFIVFGVVSLVNLTITLNEADPFLHDLLNYFACQLGGCKLNVKNLEESLRNI